MAMSFDEQQTEAINTIHTSILVSASAGAGKTGVLVARLMKRCVTDRVPIQQILAVTFTEAAAGEMKKRLAKQLHAQCDVTDDPDTLAYLNEQLIDLEAASITTIDSYCLSIIQKYYNVIGLDPACVRSVLPEGRKQTMQEEAFQMCYDALHADDPVMAEKLAGWTSPRPEDYSELLRAVTQINNCADSVLDPDAWYDAVISLYDPSPASFKDFPAPILDAFFQSFQITLENVRSDIKRMYTFALDDSKIVTDQLDTKMIALDNCINALKDHNYGLYCTALDDFACMKTPASSKNKPYCSVRTSMEKKIKSLLADRYSEKQYLSDAKEMAPFANALITLARRTREQYQNTKRSEHCIDFADMERFAYDILIKNNGTIANTIKESLQEIMIDEFQDTSELQNAIIEQIAKKDNVFRVGDVKQSIYAFRQAKPSMMRSLMRDPDNHLIQLRHNYRSKDSIVRFTNLLFERIMNVEGAEDTYSEEDHVSIGSDGQKEDSPVPVVFADIQMKNPAQPEADSEDESMDAKQAKASWIAQKIIELRKEDPQLSFRSIAVLTRSHTDKLYLRAAFDRTGIPYDIDAHEGFYQSELCQMIRSICTLLTDPHDAIALTSVLVCPFYDFKDEDLAKIKIHYPTLYAGIQAEHPEVFQEMDALNTVVQEQGIPALLSEIAKRHHFFERLSESQKANFDYLFDQTITAECRNLFDFMDTINASQDDRSSQAMSQGKDDDVVTVTTIHHSKGLQYNTVFLWGTSQNRFNNAKDAILVDEELGIGLRHYDMPWRTERPTVQRIAINYKQNLDDIEEFTRLLYVALTRAEKRLFIVDVNKKEFSKQPITLSLLFSRNGMSGLILSALDEGPYFSIIHPYPDLSIINQPYRAPGVDTLPHFTKLIQPLPPMSTPSSTETTSLPPLDISHSTNGKAYGTAMHEWAASLPNTSWTMEQLKGSPDPDALYAFGQSTLYQQCLLGEIHKEYPFYIERDSFRSTGTIDFLSIFTHEIILIDFKTDNASMNEIKHRYSDQLNAYRRALSILYPDHTIKAYAYSFHNNTSIEIEESDGKNLS